MGEAGVAAAHQILAELVEGVLSQLVLSGRVRLSAAALLSQLAAFCPSCVELLVSRVVGLSAASTECRGLIYSIVQWLCQQSQTQQVSQ